MSYINICNFKGVFNYISFIPWPHFCMVSISTCISNIYAYIFLTIYAILYIPIYDYVLYVYKNLYIKQ